MTQARRPHTNSDLPHPSLARINSVINNVPPNGDMTAATTIVSVSGLGGNPGDWNGAIAMIGAGQNWVSQSGTVVASATNSLTIAYQHYNHYQTPTVGN